MRSHLAVAVVLVAVAGCYPEPVEPEVPASEPAPVRVAQLHGAEAFRVASSTTSEGGGTLRLRLSSGPCFDAKGGRVDFLDFDFEATALDSGPVGFAAPAARGRRWSSDFDQGLVLDRTFTSGVIRLERHGERVVAGSFRGVFDDGGVLEGELHAEPCPRSLLP